MLRFFLLLFFPVYGAGLHTNKYRLLKIPGLNPSGAMTFSCLRKAMGGGKNYPPPTGSYISESVHAPIYFLPFSTLEMRKIATKNRFLSYIPFR
jgi:hypothetical protein